MDLFSEAAFSQPASQMRMPVKSAEMAKGSARFESFSTGMEVKPDTSWLNRREIDYLAW